MSVYRCFSEKREGFCLEANSIKRELIDFLGIKVLKSVRILNRYDIEGVSESVYKAARQTVLSEPQTDIIYDDVAPEFGEKTQTLILEAMPGQLDQRATSCASCLQLLDINKSIPTVKTAKVYVFYGDLSENDMTKIKGHIINAVETREAKAEKPETLAVRHPEPKPAITIDGFIEADDNILSKYLSDFSLAMDMADIRMLQEYFRDTEGRDPTITEIRVLDTYWSDHCRHTTFFTHLTNVKVEDPDVFEAYRSYLDARRETYGSNADDRPQTLMDIATISAKTLRSRGLLSNIEDSEEVNACSIHIDANVDGRIEDWLLMFKNETHNHPTEVEPFGGAATCVGGAIRDPLSGRAYVYQAMRITGASDPRVGIEETLPGKLPQRKITLTAAHGNSSYGNQIGLPSGLVHEIYHPGYVAKRMELGAVVGAVKTEHVIRETPVPGDKVILLGGKTGRDGIGGATGSSKTQTTESLVTMAAEVQKGDAAEERKIQRLFLDPEVTKMIKKCNDFGAGGVSVAVGELADGLDIDLNLVRTKYEGLNGTEIALSESQERMAVVVAPGDVDAFITKAAGEDLDAYVIADVTDTNRMVIRFNGESIVNISRDFLSTNGAVKYATVQVPRYDTPDTDGHKSSTIGERLKSLVTDLRYCSQRGLQEMFDGTVGTSAVLVKNGGITQSTPAQSMASLLPVKYDSETSTCSVMAFGFDPVLSTKNPFIGAKTAVITSVAKLVACGCDPEKAYLTFQEYFERLANDPTRWGKPFSALLGAFEAQMGLGLAAIGGKDSMSGSFGNLDVPPTLVSFAIAPNDAEFVITPEFKKSGHEVVLIDTSENLDTLKESWKTVRKLVEDKTIISAWAVSDGGIAEGIFKMALGNELGFELNVNVDSDAFFTHPAGAVIAEVTKPIDGAMVIGKIISDPVIKLGNETINISELKSSWEEVLEDIFPTKTEISGDIKKVSFDNRSVIRTSESFAKPRALVMCFPGTNSELDAARAVTQSGGVAEILVIKNMTPAMLEESISETSKAIAKSQIIILPGGSSLGDEPDGSAKFINLFFRNPVITDSIREHLNLRNGLMLGLCNGFQALIKLGLVPFGDIVTPNPENPTLVQNLIGRHQARYIYTRVASVNSPWMSLSNVGDIHTIAISHGEGRFVALPKQLEHLVNNGQIATQYTCKDGIPSMETLINPNGSALAVEGLFSPDGKVFGKMGHSERYGKHVAKNIYGVKHQPIFESGINYFK